MSDGIRSALSELAADVVVLGAALYHRNWPPRRWLASYGGLDVIRSDGDGLIGELIREYRTIRRGKMQQMERRKHYGNLAW